jgi:GT2 family glycosyltransferase
MEIVVSDNESTDDSAAVAAAFGARVTTCAGVGVAAVRNAGARLARGDVLAFIDADHTVGADWIGRAAAIIDEYPLIAAVGAPCVAPDNSTWVQRVVDANRVRPRGVEYVDWLGAGALVVRRSAFLRAGGFDETLEACEDVALCKSLRATGARLAADEQLATVHYGDPATLSALFFGELWRGRDNVRVSVRRPFALRELKGLFLSATMLLSVATAVVLTLSAAWIGWYPGLAMWALAFLVPVPRAYRMLRRLPSTWIVNAYVVSVVYELARALALVLKAPHHRQRRAGGRMEQIATPWPEATGQLRGAETMVNRRDG